MSDRKYDPEYETELRRNFLSSSARDKFDRWLSELIRKEREAAVDYYASQVNAHIEMWGTDVGVEPWPENPYRKEQP